MVMVKLLLIARSQDSLNLFIPSGTYGVSPQASCMLPLNPKLWTVLYPLLDSTHPALSSLFSARWFFGRPLFLPHLKATLGILRTCPHHFSRKIIVLQCKKNAKSLATFSTLLIHLSTCIVYFKIVTDLNSANYQC